VFAWGAESHARVASLQKAGTELAPTDSIARHKLWHCRHGRDSLALSEMRWRAANDAPNAPGAAAALEADIGAAERAVDRARLRLFQDAVKHSRLMRALELAGQLNLTRSVEGGGFWNK
jgi:hypothetical protein